MKKYVVLIVMAAVLFSAAQVNGDAPRVWVVSIGVSKYVKSLHALPKAADDAREFANAIAEARPGATDVKILATGADDESMQPTKANVISALDELSRSVQPEDLVIVYFCGHGIEESGQQRLLTKDAGLTSPELLDLGSITLPDLRKKIEALPCSGKLLVLDACRESVQSLSTSAGVSQPVAVRRDFLTSGGG